jgi:hypothetical protein
MNWFTKATKTELERRNLKVIEKGHSAFQFVSENIHGKTAGVYCRPHGHLNAPEKNKLRNLAHRLSLDSVYIASEAYTDLKRHVVKVVELK